MTESEWLASTDAQRMLALLTTGGEVAEVRPGVYECPPIPGMATERKLRLFAVACCRAVWGQLTDPRSWRAVEVAERYADGLATDGEYLDAGGQAGRVPRRADNQPAVMAAAAVGQLVADAAGCAGQVIGWLNPLRQHAAQAALLRDLCGNPWRPVHRTDVKPGDKLKLQIDPTCRLVKATPRDRIAATVVAVNEKGMTVQPANAPGAHGIWTVPPPDWLRWNDGTVPKIAQAIYDGRRFDEMPILADALEEAGCDNEDLLMHCRGRERCECLGEFGFRANSTWIPCERCDPEGACYREDGLPVGDGWKPLGCGHVRGCWVLDLLLGKT